MGHLPSLIADLALILIAGAITTLLFRKIKQPIVLGYIIAGFLVGPHLSLTPTVADTANIEVWAKIGVIFLLFNLGLEFSFKKLKRVGGSASITGLVEIAFTSVLGYFAGQWLGWSVMDSLFLGGMLASSSTTIIIKAFDEMGLKTQRFAQVVFGVLIIEDIVVILLMVLLSTVAVTREFEGMEMMFIVAKLVFFLILWFIAGIFIIPTLLKKAKNILDEETLLILSIGLCLGMVIVATKVGFSAELGAFIMGSILAETTSAEKIERISKPVKDLFGAIFFVSVGMLIDPKAIVEYGVPVMVITLLMVVGKLFSAVIGALISGQPLKQSVQVGMSMAQIGEFAFIVASLGLSLGVTSDFLFPVAVGVSAISTFTTPYMIRYSPAAYNLLVRILPEKWLSAIQYYSTENRTTQEKSNWKKVLGLYLQIILTNGFIILALVILIFKIFIPFLEVQLADEVLRSIIALVVSVSIVAPFLWLFMTKKPNQITYKEIWHDAKHSGVPLLILEITRILIGIAVLCILVIKIIPTTIAMLILVPLIIALLFLFSKRINKLSNRIENRFLNNLNAREDAAAAKLGGKENQIKKHFESTTGLLQWDIHLVELEVRRFASSVGKTLSEIDWRELYGINIVYIKRDDKLIYAPDIDERILPFDHVGVIATDEQMQLFKPAFDKEQTIVPTVENVEDIVVQNFEVNELNKLKGHTILSSGIKERSNALVIGLERNNERFVNPRPDTVFESGDIVWVVGERKKIKLLNKVS